MRQVASPGGSGSFGVTATVVSQPDSTRPRAVRTAAAGRTDRVLDGITGRRSLRTGALLHLLSRARVSRVPQIVGSDRVTGSEGRARTRTSRSEVVGGASGLCGLRL